AVGLEPPIEHPLRLLFLGGDKADGLLVKPRRHGIGLNGGFKAPAVLLAGDFANFCVGSRHFYLIAAKQLTLNIGWLVRLEAGSKKTFLDNPSATKRRL